MTSRSSARAGSTVAVVLLVVGVVILGLRSGTTTITYDHSPPVTPPDDGTPVVAFLRAPGGLAPLGIRIVQPTHTVEVQFLAAPGCSALLTTDESWPTTHPECAIPVDLTGTVGGLGVTPTGRSLVGVAFAVSKACFEQLEVGMPWPTEIPECGG